MTTAEGPDFAAEQPGPGIPGRGNAETLRRYWAEGKGAAQIRWGSEGDFDRCTRLLEEHGHFTPEQAHGYCNNLHHRALGFYPATHKKMEHASAEEPEAAFDESSVTRVPAGGATGGQFAPGGTGAAPTNEKPVQQGQDSQQVRDLQKRLNALGAHLTVDGKFGPETLKAVRAYQQANGLKVDGLVGPRTTAALRLKVQKTAKTTTVKPGSGAGKTETVKPGSAPGKTTTVKPSPGKTSRAGQKLSDKPGSITAAQKAAIRTAVRDRVVPGPDAADATSPREMNALAESEAQALIAHLKTFPKRKPGRTAKTAPRTIAAAEPGPAGGTVQVPALITIPGVDILAAGTWALSSGRQTFTREDLEQAVEAAACPAVGGPVIKIGHLDQRFAPGPHDDGEPAIGKVANLRLNDSGTKVLGDLAGMPGWLATVAASAFPRRSVEGKYGFTCQIGHRHPFVLTGLALLGVTPPGVGVLGGLDDIAALYGVTAGAPAPEWHAEQTQEGTVMPVSEEDVRRAWYAAGGAPPSWWITELQMSPAQLIVADEASGTIYRVPFSIEGSAVTFGDADQIVSYAEVAAARGTGPAVLYASAADSRAGVVVAAWDGAAAVRNLGDDPSAGQLRALFALPGSTKLDSSLPHHDVSSGGQVGAANPQGCSAAIAALNGARGGLTGVAASAKKTAYGHLAAHLRQACREPPDFKGTADEPGIPEGDPGSFDEWAAEDRLARLAAIRAAAAADPAAGELIASLDASLDQAAGEDDAGQAAGLLAAAEATAGELMDLLGIDDPGVEDGELEAASGDAGEAGLHGTHTGEHSHPHPTTGDQGGDELHEHMHSHSGDGRHDHAHATQAAAAASQEGGDSDMGFEFTDQQMAAIRSRLGKKDGEAVTTEEVFKAVDTPRAPTVAAAAGASGDPDVQVPQISDGTYLVDGEILRKYQERAVAGDQAVQAMHLAERDTILATAVSDGKFSLARKPHFESLWDKDPEGTRNLVAKLAPGLVPMGPPVGFAGEFGGDPDLPGDFEGQQAYRELYPDDYAREREQRRARTAGR